MGRYSIYKLVSRTSVGGPSRLHSHTDIVIVLAVPVIFQAGPSGPRHEEKGHQDREPEPDRAYKDMSPVGEDMGVPVLERNSPPCRYVWQGDREKQAAWNKNHIAVSTCMIESRVKICDWFLETV